MKDSIPFFFDTLLFVLRSGHKYCAAYKARFIRALFPILFKFFSNKNLHNHAQLLRDMEMNIYRFRNGSIGKYFESIVLELKKVLKTSQWYLEIGGIEVLQI